MFRLMNSNRNVIVSALLIGFLSVVVQGASLNLRVTTDKDVYVVGEEVNWTIWAWASVGDNRGAAYFNLSLNDNRDETLNPVLTVGVPPDEEFLDTEFGLEENFYIINKGDSSPTPPRLSSIKTGQDPRLLDVGNDGQPHILCKGVYTVTKVGLHDLTALQNISLYWPDETSDPEVFDPNENYPASFTVYPTSYELQFEHYIDDGSTPDTFTAKGSDIAGVSVDYDAVDVLQPPLPPFGDNVQAYTTPIGTPGGQHITIDAQPYEPNAPDNTWQIELNAHDDIFVGLTGTAHFDLIDPNALNGIMPDTLVYLRRLDSYGNLVQYYDLTDPANHSISWSVTEVQNHYATMELQIVAETIASNSDDVEPVSITLSDFSVTASDWLDSETTARLDGDANGDGNVDIDDLLLQVKYWLYDENSL